MAPAIISLIAWTPFLLLAIILGITFSLKGYKRGAARAGISIGVTVIACLVSILVSKLIATALAGTFSPMLANALSSAGLKAGADKLASLATSLASAFVALLLYVPVFTIFVSVLKPVASFIAKKFLRDAKHKANKFGGLSIAIVDALLVTMLATLPLYGTLALVDGFVEALGDKNDEATQMISAATDPFIVDVANVPPFSTAYDALMSCEIDGTTVNISGTIRETAVVLRNAGDVSFKKGEFSKKPVIALLNSTEKLLTKNKFVTDFICEYMGGKLPSVKMPGIGKIKLNEYYPALSNGKQLRSDLPAIFDLTEAMVNSGMAEALVNKDTDMSKVNANMVSKAFGNTLNHSVPLATFKSNLLNSVVDSFSKDIIDKGKDEDGSVKALCDAISSIPTDPLDKDDAKKEGEAFYLLMSGLITSSNKKTNTMGLGMMLEGLARHPMVGVDKVMNATGTIMKNSDADISPSLLDKMEENLLLSVNKPIGQNSFGKYCNTAFITMDAFSGIGGGKDENGENKKETSRESLQDLITSDKESLEAVKDTVSSDLMADLGIEDKHTDAFKDVVDATFDSIIESDCADDEVEKEAESLGSILDTVSNVTENPEQTDDIVKEYTIEILDECLESKIVSGMITKLASKGKPDPLGLFKELTPDAKVSVEATIDEYIADAKSDEDIAVLEAYKLFVGIQNND